MVLSWHFDALQRFTEIANAEIAADESLKPTWLSTVDDPSTNGKTISASSFLQDMVNLLSKINNTHFGHTYFGPNTRQQYENLLLCLRDVQNDAFVQTCMRQMEQGQVLAKLLLCLITPMADAVEASFVAPLDSQILPVFQ